MTVDQRPFGHRLRGGRRRPRPDHHLHHQDRGRGHPRPRPPPARGTRRHHGEPSPYVLIRANLWALIDRKSFYRLVDLGCHHRTTGTAGFGLWSSGQFFPGHPVVRIALRSPPCMPRFAANLTLLFTEVPVLDRPDWAARCGFDGVEVLFPMTTPWPTGNARGRPALALINTRPGTGPGRPGLAAVPGMEDALSRKLPARGGICPRLKADGCTSWQASPRARRPNSAIPRTWAWALSQAPDQTLTIEPLNPDDMPGYFLNDYDQAARILMTCQTRARVRVRPAGTPRGLHGDASAVWADHRHRINHVQIAAFRPQRTRRRRVLAARPLR